MFSYPFYLFERYDNMHFFFKTNLKMSLFYVLDIIGDIGKNIMVGPSFAAAVGYECILHGTLLGTISVPWPSRFPRWYDLPLSPLSLLLSHITHTYLTITPLAADSGALAC